MLKPPSSWCWWIYLEDDDHVTMFDPRQRQRFEPLPGNHTYLVPVKHLGSDVGRLRRYTWKRSGGTIDGGKSSCSDGWKDVKRWRDKLIVLIKSCQSFSRFFTRESSCGLSKCDLPPKGHQETNFDWIGWIGWNMFTGNHHIKNGKNPGFWWRFSQQNQSFGKSLQVTTGWDGGAPPWPSCETSKWRLDDGGFPWMNPRNGSQPPLFLDSYKIFEKWMMNPRKGSLLDQFSS